MVIYIIIDVGCLECEVPSELLGTYRTYDEAMKHHPEAVSPDEPRFSQSCKMIFGITIPTEM